MISFDDIELEDRVKIDNLIQLTKNINTRLSQPKNFFINYNDIEEFLNDLALLCWNTGMFDEKEIIGIYTEKDFSERLEMSQKMIKKIINLSNKMKDIGKMAERNL